MTGSASKRRFNPYATGAVSILAAVAAGTLLLMAPFSRADCRWGDFSDSLFTAFSAVCVTGLSVIDVGSELSRCGLAIMTALVEIGGLGYMTFGTLLLVAVGRKLSMSDESTALTAYGSEDIRGVKSLLVRTFLITAAVQSAGIVTLWSRLAEAPPYSARALCDASAWGKAVFYTAMAWSNAGFGLEPDSLRFAAHDPVIYHTCGILGTVGGLGFLVVYSLATFRRGARGRKPHARLSLHVKLALSVSFTLLAAGTVLFAVLEWNHSLAGFGAADKISLSLFHAATPRTIGLSVLGVEDMTPATVLLNDVLMFCGASPGSTGGGVKTTTIAVLVCTLIAMCRGRDETVIFKRQINNEIVRESIVIFFLYAAVVFLATGILLVTESPGPGSFGRYLFEAVSAVSTTGLSIGDTTASLSQAGRVAIMACMLFGRLGALSIVFMIGRGQKHSRIRYPAEELIVG